MSYAIFQSFTDPALAQEVAEVLKANQVNYKISNTSPVLDQAIIGVQYNPDWRLELQPQDFAKGRQVLLHMYSRLAESAEPDYYLFGFSDKELLEIIHKPDEWGMYDYALAQKILREHGIPVEAADIEQFAQSRNAELARPENISDFWIILGYGLSVAISPMGLVYALSLISAKKTLPDGKRVPAYTEMDRYHGKWMLAVAATGTALLLYMGLGKNGLLYHLRNL